MKTLMGLGKVLAALFWGVVLANLLSPFAQPFALLLHVAGVLILLVHGLELVLFKAHVDGSPRPGLERVHILLFGIFHLLGRPQAQPVADAQPFENARLEGEQA
ncbi:DUF1145 domain-containing protein [Pseudomonas sp. CrR25]|nr:DUF1145 domain-containing protein [Pseudomonas sp. CrR25]